MMPLTLTVLLHTAVHERLLRTGEDFMWPVDVTFHGRFIIDVEFLDLKIYSLNVSSFVQLSRGRSDMGAGICLS